jgi:steroid delta-isomerase-like uncharacterized protein
MGAQDNIARHRQSLEAFNRRDMDGVVAVYADEFTTIDHAQGQTIKSADGIRAWNQAWLDAFSDGKVQDIQCIGADDWTVARFVGRGANDGPMTGNDPTGQRVELSLCDVARWRDGRIVEQHLYYDIYGMLVQLGLAPAPSMPG